MKTIFKNIISKGIVGCCLAFMLAGATSCSKDKDFGKELSAAVLINELDASVGNSLSMAPGMTFHVMANIMTEDVTYPTLLWKSYDESVVTVSSTGILEAKAVGQTTINVTQEPNMNVLKSFTVVVKPVATAITLQKATLYQRSSKQLTVDVVPADGYDVFDWISSDESIATVDENGVVTASNENFGRVMITAKTKDGSNLSSSAVIEVKEIVPVTGINLFGPGYDLSIGGKGTITTTLEPSDATADMLEWTSSNEEIVTVSETGVVTGVNYGTATITAKAESGVTQSIDITVGEGTINQDFADGMGSWKVEQSGSSIQQNNGYITISMQGGGTSKWRGDFGPAIYNGGQAVTMNVGVYRYLAVKMTRPGKYIANNNGQGTIVLDTGKGRYQQKTGNGNNRYDILGYEADQYADVPMDKPVVIYFDLQSGFGNTPYLFPTDGVETLSLFKLLVADIPTDDSGKYDIYWAHTFKTLEEMEAFAAKH